MILYMKKSLLVLGMITCIFGLTACGTEKEDDSIMTVEEAVTTGEAYVQKAVDIFESGSLEEYAEDEEYTLFAEAVESLESASEDMGSYIGMVSSEATVDDESAVVSVTVDGSDHDAVIEVIIEKDGVESITTNVEYSFGESMEKAALNTLLGMGTVFVVLILICFIISGFKYISVVEEKIKNRKVNNAAEEEKTAPAPAPAPVPVAAPVQVENLTDDLELVAVIAAAIAASEGRTTTDGLVVRSIRKANKNKWQNAL